MATTVNQFNDSRVVTPTLNLWGNSFAELESQHELGAGRGAFDQDVETRGHIDRDKLNKNKLRNQVEFNSFEEDIKDFVLAMLGHPVVRVELAPIQLKMAVDQAVTKLYYHCPVFSLQMASFQTTRGRNIYKIPMSVLDNLEYVTYKKSLLSIQSQSGTLEFDFFIKYFQDNFLFQNFGVSDFFMLQQHLEQVRKVLGQEGSFDVINNQYLQLYPVPSVNQDVILIYRALDSNTMLPYYLSWIQRYAFLLSEIEEPPYWTAF
jgi:hypothetical protein